MYRQRLTALGGGLRNKIRLIILEGLNKEHCIGDYLFAKNVRKLVSQSGLFFKALYLNFILSYILRIAFKWLMPGTNVLMIDY